MGHLGGKNIARCEESYVSVAAGWASRTAASSAAKKMELKIGAVYDCRPGDG